MSVLYFTDLLCVETITLGENPIAPFMLKIYLDIYTYRGRRGMSARLRLNAPWLENSVRQDCDISHSE